MTLTHQSLLDAMDGVAMILDDDLCIAQIGLPNWQTFLKDNPPQDPALFDCTPEQVLGRPLTQFIAGEIVRRTYADLFFDVLSSARSFVRIGYRCDAPTLRRDMRLSVRPITSNGHVRHLLYQSVQIGVQERPPIPLFGAPILDRDADDILTLCAICARVAWPIGAPVGAREWVEPAEYYRRDGGDVAQVSHGFCEDCFAKLQQEG